MTAEERLARIESEVNAQKSRLNALRAERVAASVRTCRALSTTRDRAQNRKKVFANG
jgi:hypothetical protein